MNDVLLLSSLALTIGMFLSSYLRYFLFTKLYILIAAIIAILVGVCLCCCCLLILTVVLFSVIIYVCIVRNTKNEGKEYSINIHIFILYYSNS